MTNLPQLLAAFQDNETSNGRENSHRALYKLAEHGLVVQAAATPATLATLATPATSIAHFITSTLLNHTAPNHPSQHNFQLQLQSQPGSMLIPDKSRLLLRCLAGHYNINIFLFSSRSKARRFTSPNAVHTVGFFHHVDSYFQTSEYLVLTGAQQPLPIQQVPAPPQQPGGGAPGSVAVFRTQARGQTQQQTPQTPQKGKRQRGQGVSQEEKEVMMNAVKRSW